MSVLDEFRLDGKVALVTGAGRGIGLAIAQAFAEAGAAVAIQDIVQEIAEAEAQELRDSGRRAVALGGDATNLADVESWVTQTRETLGAPGIDILVNNAAIQSQMDFDAWTVEQLETQVRANMMGPWRLCQLVVPHMRERGWGRILNVGSIQGSKGGLGMGFYAPMKAALHNFTQGLARSFGQHGITANTIAPGMYDTVRNKEWLDKNGHNKAVNWLPLRRIGEPDDCAGPALLLCSDAGKYITGVLLSVDGGMHI